MLKVIEIKELTTELMVTTEGCFERRARRIWKHATIDRDQVEAKVPSLTELEQAYVEYKRENNE